MHKRHTIVSNRAFFQIRATMNRIDSSEDFLFETSMLFEETQRYMSDPLLFCSPASNFADFV